MALSDILESKYLINIHLLENKECPSLNENVNNNNKIEKDSCISHLCIAEEKESDFCNLKEEEFVLSHGFMFHGPLPLRQKHQSRRAS